MTLTYIDIDGVLNPLFSYTLEEDGFKTVSIGWATWSLNANKHAPLLAELSKLSTMVWCSSWEEESNAICSLFNLPPFKYVEFTPAPVPLRENTSWKLRDIQRHSSLYPDEKLIWIEDEISPDMHSWAKYRGLEKTLIVECNPAIGLQEEEYFQAMNFLAHP